METHLLTEQSTGGEISINLVKDFFAGKKKIKPEHESFYDYYLKFVEDKKNEGKAQDTIRMVPSNILCKRQTTGFKSFILESCFQI